MSTFINKSINQSDYKLGRNTGLFWFDSCKHPACDILVINYHFTTGINSSVVGHVQQICLQYINSSSLCLTKTNEVFANETSRCCVLYVPNQLEFSGKQLVRYLSDRLCVSHCVPMFPLTFTGIFLPVIGAFTQTANSFTSFWILGGLRLSIAVSQPWV